MKLSECIIYLVRNIKKKMSEAQFEDFVLGVNFIFYTIFMLLFLILCIYKGLNMKGS